MSNKYNKVQAIPPEDYKGSLVIWINTLIEWGWWPNEIEDLYDVVITQTQYDKLLNHCES